MAGPCENQRPRIETRTQLIAEGSFVNLAVADLLAEGRLDLDHRERGDEELAGGIRQERKHFGRTRFHVVRLGQGAGIEKITGHQKRSSRWRAKSSASDPGILASARWTCSSVTVQSASVAMKGT